MPSISDCCGAEAGAGRKGGSRPARKGYEDGAGGGSGHDRRTWPSVMADVGTSTGRSMPKPLSRTSAYRRQASGATAWVRSATAAQIDAYLTDGLWLDNARQSNAMAARLGDGLKAVPDTGLLAVPQANIVFCRLPQHVTDGLLAEGYAFYHDRWEPGIVRFVTAFSHSADDIDQLLDAVRRHTR
jgi:threonine aldolase